MAWKNEKEFSKYVMQNLRDDGLNCMRIETAATLTGCPDLYVQGHGDDWFIELKNMPACKVDDFFYGNMKVEWRPGQQAWAAEYKRCHAKKTGDFNATFKHSWTIVGCKDGVIMIRMYEPFHLNYIGTVHAHNCFCPIKGSIYTTLKRQTYTSNVIKGCSVDYALFSLLNDYVYRHNDCMPTDIDLPFTSDFCSEICSEWTSSNIDTLHTSGLTVEQLNKINALALSVLMSYKENDGAARV